MIHTINSNNPALTLSIPKIPKQISNNNCVKFYKQLKAKKNVTQIKPLNMLSPKKLIQ